MPGRVGGFLGAIGGQVLPHCQKQGLQEIQKVRVAASVGVSVRPQWNVYACVSVCIPVAICVYV